MTKLRWATLLKIPLRLMPHRFPREIGLFEALGYPIIGSLEWTRRHAMLLGELERIRLLNGLETLTVLDFGGGRGSLAKAAVLYGLDRHYRFVLADVDAAAINGYASDGLVLESLLLDPDGSIPLDRKAIDVAVSSDVFEHIEAGRRSHWAAELARVSRLGQVHTFPADSRDGRWASTVTDRALAAWHRTRFGVGERWTEEHLMGQQPLIEEMTLLFGPCDVRGFANTAVWTAMLHDQLRGGSRFSKLRFALRYLATLRIADRQAPFKACVLTSQRVG